METRKLIPLFTVVLAAVASSAADNFTLDWWTVAGGGGLSTSDPSGTFWLSGTIGQSDAGVVMTGGGFELTAGFWAVPAGPSILIGDLNCDGEVDFGDINAFVLYLSNFSAWQTTYAGCPPENGDINGDGLYPSFGDINPFVALLSS